MKDQVILPMWIYIMSFWMAYGVYRLVRKLEPDSERIVADRVGISIELLQKLYVFTAMIPIVNWLMITAFVLDYIAIQNRRRRQRRAVKPLLKFFQKNHKKFDPSSTKPKNVEELEQLIRKITEDTVSNPDSSCCITGRHIRS